MTTTATNPSKQAIEHEAHLLGLQTSEVEDILNWNKNDLALNGMLLMQQVHKHLIVKWNLKDNAARENPFWDAEQVVHYEKVSDTFLQKCIGYTKAFMVHRCDELKYWGSDSLGVLSHVFAYSFAAREDFVPPTKDAFEKVLEFVKQDEAFVTVRALLHIGADEDVVQEYENIRYDQWSVLAVVLRTYIQDMIHGARDAFTLSEKYKADYTKASVYLAMLNDNCDITPDALIALGVCTYEYMYAASFPSKVEVTEEESKQRNLIRVKGLTEFIEQMCEHGFNEWQSLKEGTASL